jgi:hypothetical protein
LTTWEANLSADGLASTVHENNGRATGRIGLERVSRDRRKNGRAKTKYAGYKKRFLESVHFLFEPNFLLKKQR